MHGNRNVKTFATSFLVFSKKVFFKYHIGMTRYMESVSQ